MNPLVPFNPQMAELVMPKEVEEALAHASPETVRSIKGAIWRARALQTMKDDVFIATSTTAATMRDQCQMRPLERGETIEGVVEFTAEQSPGGCGGNHGVALRGRFGVRRY